MHHLINNIYDQRNSSGSGNNPFGESSRKWREVLYSGPRTSVEPPKADGKIPMGIVARPFWKSCEERIGRQ